MWYLSMELSFQLNLMGIIFHNNILYIIVPCMQKTSFLTKIGKKVQAVKFQCSFASDRKMLIAFLG